MYPDPNVPLWEIPNYKPYIYSGYLWVVIPKNPQREHYIETMGTLLGPNCPLMVDFLKMFFMLFTLPETNSQSTWKWMVGIRSGFLLGRPVSFRDDKTPIPQRLVGQGSWPSCPWRIHGTNLPIFTFRECKYLGPKWGPLFWLEKTLFWRVQPPK